MLTTLGPDGWETLREKPDRIRAVREEVEALGLTVKAQYALMGQYDFLNIIDAPDEQTMAKAAIMLAARGTMRTHDVAGDRRRGSDRSVEVVAPARERAGVRSTRCERRRSSRRSLASKSTGSSEPSERRRTRNCSRSAACTISATSNPRLHRCFEAGSHLDMGSGPHRVSRLGIRLASARVPGPFPTLRHERRCWAAGDEVVVGIDEVGRGSWAGPVTVGAVVAPPEHLAGVKDSKLLTPAEREVCARRVRSWARGIGIGHASHDECDYLGMTEALRLAATRALEQLAAQGFEPDRIVLDGNLDYLRDARERCRRSSRATRRSFRSRPRPWSPR